MEDNCGGQTLGNIRTMAITHVLTEDLPEGIMNYLLGNLTDELQVSVY